MGLKINLKNHPNMIRLKKEDEDLNTFKNLPTEELLLRWMNYHLRNAGSDRVVKNFSGDLKVFFFFFSFFIIIYRMQLTTRSF